MPVAQAISADLFGAGATATAAILTDLRRDPALWKPLEPIVHTILRCLPARYSCLQRCNNLPRRPYLQTSTAVPLSGLQLRLGP